MTNDYIDPLYYRLQPNSPAIHKGINIPSVKTDFFGNIRNINPSIGACEFSEINNLTDSIIELNKTITLAISRIESLSEYIKLHNGKP